MSLRHIILTMLSVEDMTGYEITKEFDLVAGFFWKAPHQNVYRDLQKMVDARLVSFKDVKQSDKPDKKIYSVTTAGKEELKNWFSTYSAPPPLRDPLLVKFYSAGVVGVEDLSNQLRQAKVAHTQKLEMYLAIEKEYYSGKPEEMPSDIALIYMNLRLGIIREQGWLEWAKEAQQTINQISKTK